MIDGKRFVTAEVLGNSSDPVMIPIPQDQVYLRVDADFKDRKDEGRFYYSLDGLTWIAIGTALHMEYSIPHFMGYRFALFNYATKSTGGYVDFDFFRLPQQPITISSQTKLR